MACLAARFKAPSGLLFLILIATMAAAALALSYNVDALEPCGEQQLVAGLSNFSGPHWTGALALLSTQGDGAAPKLEALLELRAGVPAVACLPVADEFTGG